MLTFKIYTLGCKVNQYDSQDLRQKLQADGWQGLKLNDIQEASLVIINTCSVTKNAQRKDKLMIKRARRENPQAKIAVIGCWLKICPKAKTQVEADLFWTVGNLDNLRQEINKLFNINNKKRIELNKKLFSQDNKKLNVESPEKSERSRYFIKVQEGCEQFCAYCIIPYSRGKLQSRSVKEILQEARRAEKAGYNEIVLCGTHLGLYGQEKDSPDQKKNLAYLIKQIIANTQRIRVRLSSIEINDVTKELISLMKEERFCSHWHIPLQGGDDEILRLMKRPYNTAYFRKKIEEIRKFTPEATITADVIAGFPSETEAQFENACHFIEELALNKLHVFSYSKHERTAAAKMSGHLDNNTKQKRARKLRKLSEKLWQKYQKKICKDKNELEVIIEFIQAGEAIGKTEYYFNLKVTGQGLGRLNVGELMLVEKDENNNWQLKNNT